MILHVSRRLLSNLSAIVGFGALVVAVVASLMGVVEPVHIRLLAGIVFFYGAVYFSLISEHRHARPEWIVPFYLGAGALCLLSALRLIVAIGVDRVEALATTGLLFFCLWLWWAIAVNWMGDRPFIVETVDEGVVSVVVDREDEE